MFTNRISDEMTAVADANVFQPQAFCLMAMPALAAATQTSPLQSLYQQMYEQAQRAQARPRMPELFAIMN